MNKTLYFLTLVLIILSTSLSAQVLSENFDAGGFPASWARGPATNCSNTSWTAWMHTSEVLSSGNDWCGGGCNTGRGGSGYCINFYDWYFTGVSGNYCETPSNDLSSFSTATLTFWHTNNDGSDVINVYAKQGAGAYTLVGGPYAALGNNWDQKTINMSAYAGAGFNSVKIKFEGSGVCGGSNIGIDDVVLTGFGSACSTVAGTVSASPTNVCPSGGNTTATLTGYDPTATIQWYYSVDNINWFLGPTGTQTFSGAIIQTTYVKAEVTNGCTSTSNTVTITAGCTITQPTSGATSSTISCGNTYNYYDSGGSASNYSNSENGLITICPSVAGQYVSVNFTSDALSSADLLYVYDGDNGSANLIGVYTGSGTLTSAGTITASSDNPSGCLSFRFRSSSSSTNTGWVATITCVSTAASPYPAHSEEDCNGAIVICSNSALAGGTSGYGMHELPTQWNYCLGTGEYGENYSQWYVFSPATSGTVSFLISPTSTTDYDWAIWGPYNSLQCPSFTNDPTLRCSGTSSFDSGPLGETGLSTTDTDTIEQNGQYAACCAANGNGYLKPLTVVAGEIYVMMIDEWSGGGVGFNLTWQLSNGASLDCSPVLPVKLTSFIAQCNKTATQLEWSTETELNNNFFIIEKSDDDFNFHEIAKVFGAGNSNTTNHYSYVDEEINNKTAYYRLVQVDFDGSIEYHRIVASNCHDDSFTIVKSNLENNNLELLISTSTNENLVIQIYSSTGQLIANEKKEINAGNNNISIQNLNIRKGIYLVSIKGQYNSSAIKILAK